MLCYVDMLSKAVKSTGVERRNHAKEQRCTAAGRVDYKPVLKSQQAAYNPMVYQPESCEHNMLRRIVST